MLLAILLMVGPGEIVLAGLGNGQDVAVPQGTDLVLKFTTGQSGFALSSVRLFGPSLQGTASITFRLWDGTGTTSLAFGGSWLNVNLDPVGSSYDFTPTAIGSYELQNATSYQLSMFVSNASLLMAQSNGNVYAPTGWVEDASPGVKYSLEAVSVPEPGNLILGAIAAVGGVLFWWLKF